MRIFSYTQEGYDGHVITVEVDIRNGIPGTMIVGLAGHAVQEARARVSIALKNSGFSYPDGRVVINLSPASLPKSGTSFDVAIACALLMNTRQVGALSHRVMLLGELHLDGAVDSAPGAISAVHAGLSSGIDVFVVPQENYREARVLRRGTIIPINHLRQLWRICGDIIAGKGTTHSTDVADASDLASAPNIAGAPDPADASNLAGAPDPASTPDSAGTLSIAGTSNLAGVPKLARTSNPAGAPDLANTSDFDHIIGQGRLKRIIEVAIAGNHHCLFVGPPGTGKTFSARAMNTLAAPLTTEEAIEVTRIFSIADLLRASSALIARPPFRAPHHSISYVGMLGGGDPIAPGEIALAHNGILLLDEVLEFRRDVLQGLRQPLEEREIRISRSQRVARFPSDFLLVMTANVCPCGNFGKRNGSCFCKLDDIKRYWRRLGGAFLDRIPLRCMVTTQEGATTPARHTHESDTERRPSAKTTATRIRAAIETQRKRYRGTAIRRNGHLRADTVQRYCLLSPQQTRALHEQAMTYQLSHRATHITHTVARTLADLDGSQQIKDRHVEEALNFRRITENNSGDYSADIIEELLG